VVVKGHAAPCRAPLAVLGRWVTHALIYLSACSSTSLVWGMLTDSTVDDLKDYARTPGNAITLDFFPVWFWLLWGTAVAMHGAVVIGRFMPGSRRRRRQRAMQTPTGVRHVVAMFTDLSGSARTNERLGDDVWAALVTDHRRMVCSVTAEHGGKEVSTQGDGFFVRFDDPGHAVSCAVALQELCKIERTEGSELPPIRIGIHQGDAVHDHDDVLGQVVTVAARLLEIAKPHEIILTEPVADGVAADRLVMLKGMSQPRHVLALHWDPAAPKRSRESGRRRTRRHPGGDR
jgi:class 3 adenylate cyclase